MTLTTGGTAFNITSQLAVGAGKGWREMIVTEACLADLGDGFTVTSQGLLKLQIAEIARQDMPEGTDCSF